MKYPRILSLVMVSFFIFSCNGDNSVNEELDTDMQEPEDQDSNDAEKLLPWSMLFQIYPFPNLWTCKSRMMAQIKFM